MERKIAVMRLGKLIGKGFGYRVNAKAPTPEERAEARALLPAAIEERNALREKRRIRHEEILAADAEYQRLSAEARVADEKVGKISSTTRHFKFTVGRTIGNLFFQVMAEGDSWEDVIDKLAKKKAA